MDEDWRTTAEIYEKDRRIERLENALRCIATMDVYTPDGAEPAHEVMRKIAIEAIKE